MSHCNDILIEGGRMDGPLHNGKNYHEVRQFQTDYHLVRFYFLTRCYNEYVKSVIADLESEPYPDVIIMNSCLWDITRYGSRSIALYEKNLQRLMHHLSQSLQPETLFMWNTALPISKEISGGFLLPEISFMQATLRIDVVEANFYAHEVAVDHGFDVLDLHFHFRHHMMHRAKDGIHWNRIAHRRISNMILTHISEAWGHRLPGRVLKLPQPGSGPKGLEKEEKETYKRGVLDRSISSPGPNPFSPDFVNNNNLPNVRKANLRGDGPPDNNNNMPQRMNNNIPRPLKRPNPGPGDRGRHVRSESCDVHLIAGSYPEQINRNVRLNHPGLPPEFNIPQGMRGPRPRGIGPGPGTMGPPGPPMGPPGRLGPGSMGPPGPGMMGLSSPSQYAMQVMSSANRLNWKPYEQQQQMNIMRPRHPRQGPY